MLRMVMETKQHIAYGMVYLLLKLAFLLLELHLLKGVSQL